MATEVKLPDIGEGIEHGTVVAVLVKVGDTVEKDQSLIELGQKLETQWHRESFPDLARKNLEDFSSEVSLPDFEVQIAAAQGIRCH